MAVVLLFSVLRHGVGNWIQRRFFMSNDFVRVELVSVKETAPENVSEKGPAFFVATRITPRGSAPEAAASS